MRMSNSTRQLAIVVVSCAILASVTLILWSVLGHRKTGLGAGNEKTGRLPTKKPAQTETPVLRTEPRAPLDDEPPVMAIMYDKVEEERPVAMVVWADGRIVFAVPSGPKAHVGYLDKECRISRVNPREVATCLADIRSHGLFEWEGPIMCAGPDLGTPASIGVRDGNTRKVLCSLHEKTGMGLRLRRFSEFRSLWGKVKARILVLLPEKSEPFEKDYKDFCLRLAPIVRR